jgi:hypothetical protein
MKKIRPRGGPMKRSLAQFEREVVALLAAGHGVGTLHGRRLVEGHSSFVEKEWRKGSPPCSVSDGLARAAYGRRSPYAPKKRLSSRRAGSWKLGAGSSSRDADDPKEGEVFESRAGSRWRVADVGDKRVSVERAGHRQSGKLVWSKGALKSMREVKDGESRVRVAGDPRRRRPGKASRVRVGRRADSHQPPAGRASSHQPPASSKRIRKKLSRKIRLLVREGHPQKQAVAIAHRKLGKARRARDAESELRKLSLQALGRIYRKALRQGDDHMAYLVEREIDRRR